MVIRDSLRIVIPLVVVTILLFIINNVLHSTLIGYIATLAALLVLFVLYFFRDPERPLLAGPGEIVSPADGKVIFIGKVTDEDIGECTLVSIFMSVFDVHVNRAPTEGTVIKKYHLPGRFLSAFKDAARVENERMVTIIQDQSLTVKMVQVAGILARRIVNYLQEGQKVNKGERIGLIKFGSRVDLYLPLKVKVTVSRGCKVKAGISIIGVSDAT